MALACSKHREHQLKKEDLVFQNSSHKPELISEVYDELSRFSPQYDHPKRSGHFQGPEDRAGELAISCAMCVDHIRIERVSQIHKGLHIAMPGRKYFFGYDSSERKQKWAYKHHAIVTNVIAIDDSRNIIEVEPIHMSQREDGTLGLCKTRETFDLKKSELYLVSYKYPRYRPDQIVKRAQQALRETQKQPGSKEAQFGVYRGVTTNCEHFATWCVVGKHDVHEETSLMKRLNGMNDSRQVMKKIKTCMMYLFGNGSTVTKILFKWLFESTDEIAKILKFSFLDPNIVLSVAASLYLLYCLVMTIYYHVKYNRKEMCKSCYKGNIVDLWAQCSVYGLTSAATYFVMGGSVCISSVLSSILIIVLSVASQHYVPKIRKALMAPYGCEKKAIYRLDELNVGDIVSLSYWCLPHVAIVTEIHEDKKKGKGQIRAIHYALDSLLSTREVREEYFEVEVCTYWFPILKRHECGHLDLFPPETVVLRARQRVGERKWHASTNRSDHVCYWAKVKPHIAEEDREQGLSDSIKGKDNSPHLSTLLIGEYDVRLSSDIEVGDALKVRGSEGIVVAKECGEREMKLQLVTVKTSVKKLDYFIDLNRENVSVIRYHPAHCYLKNVRADRAKLVRGQKISIKDFMDFCILQDK